MTLQTIEVLINAHSHLTDLDVYIGQTASDSCSIEIEHTKERIKVEIIRLIEEECEANLTMDKRCDLVLFAHLIDGTGQLEKRCVRHLLQTVVDTRVWA